MSARSHFLRLTSTPSPARRSRCTRRLCKRDEAKWDVCAYVGRWGAEDGDGIGDGEGEGAGNREEVTCMQMQQMFEQ